MPNCCPEDVNFHVKCTIKIIGSAIKASNPQVTVVSEFKRNKILRQYLRAIF